METTNGEGDEVVRYCALCGDPLWEHEAEVCDACREEADDDAREDAALWASGYGLPNYAFL